MGCCVSKCKPDQNPNNVHDKRVISQSPPPSPPPNPRNIQSPPSETSDSFTCSTQSTSSLSSLSSASSFSSSLGFSKVDRSFSNEFLQSCAKENPQIVVLDPSKKPRSQVKQSVPGSTPKRARANSPNLTRQKSFRVEKERSPNTYVNGRSIMRSPSPSRRFTGHTSNNQWQPVLYTTSSYNQSKGLVKANSRPASPSRNVIGKERCVYLKKKEKNGYENVSKTEGVEVGEVLAKVNYSEPVTMADIDNAHVALDCFIFL